MNYKCVYLAPFMCDASYLGSFPRVEEQKYVARSTNNNFKSYSVRFESNNIRTTTYKGICKL